VLLIALPFLAGFSDDGGASAFFVIAGVAGLLLAVATRYAPSGKDVVDGPAVDADRAAGRRRRVV
jgi:hypothetical protein